MGKQSQSKVLPAYSRRTQAAQAGNGAVGGSLNHRGAISRGQGVLMKVLYTLWARLTGLFRKSWRERELAQEFESHLQMHIDDNIRAWTRQRRVVRRW